MIAEILGDSGKRFPCEAWLVSDHPVIFVEAAEYLLGVFAGFQFLLFWSFQTLLFFFSSYFFLTIIFRNQSRGTLSMGFLWWKLEASRGLGFRCSHLSMEFLKPLVGFFLFSFFLFFIYFFFTTLTGSFLNIMVSLCEVLCTAMKATGRGC